MLVVVKEALSVRSSNMYLMYAFAEFAGPKATAMPTSPSMLHAILAIMLHTVRI